VFAWAIVHLLTFIGINGFSFLALLPHFSFFHLVLEHDRKADGSIGSLGKQVIKRRFESYNKVWLSTVNPLDNNVRSGMNSGFQSGTMSYENSRDRLPTAYEQEHQVMNSVNYFDEKVINFIIFVFKNC